MVFARPFREAVDSLDEQDPEEIKASAPGPLPFIMAFLCGLLIAYAMAVMLNHFPPVNVPHAIKVAIIVWAGFAAATSFATAMFSGTPRALWLINSGYNLVAFIIAAVIEAVWR